MFITVSSNKNDIGRLIFNISEPYYYDKGHPLENNVMYLGTLRKDVIDSVREGKTNPMQAWWIAEKIMNADFTDNDKRHLISQLAQHLPAVTIKDLVLFQKKALNDPIAIQLKWDDWMLQAMKWM
jgi:hypothetical protein